MQRELAWLYAETGAAIVACVGGMDPRAERRALERGAHIVVGTPGRLRDHLERRALDLTQLRSVVLDEADEMLDLGFREDLEFILEATPAERRTLLFSATLPKAIVALASRYQRDALRIETGGAARGHEDIDYRVIRVMANERVHAIVNILRYVDLALCHHLLQYARQRAPPLGSVVRARFRRGHALRRAVAERAQPRAASPARPSGDGLRRHRRRRARARPAEPRVGHPRRSAERPAGAAAPQRPYRPRRPQGRFGSCWCRRPRSAAPTALLDMARLTATFGGPPTAESIRERDQQRLLADPMLSEAASDDDLAMGRRLLEGASAEQIAAALRARLPRAPAGAGGRHRPGRRRATPRARAPRAAPRF